MKYVVTLAGTVKAHYTQTEFNMFYFAEFGTDCGNPEAITQSLSENQMTYLGRGYSVTAQPDPGANPAAAYSQGYCSHSKKYTQKFQTFQFDYCPDCKKEV